MSSQLTQRDSLDTESELLPQEPSPWAIRWTAWLLIAAFLLALLIAIVMQLPETVDCRFVLIPATESRFVALGSLDSYEIASRTAQALPLRMGEGDAHIIVGGRKPIEDAFEPIRNCVRASSSKQRCRNDRPG
jgi:hypothetical protein